MKRGWPGLRLLLCWLPLWLAITASAHAAPVSLEGRLEHFADASGALPFEAVSQADFVRSHFVRLPEFRSLGYGTDSHWFHFELGPEYSDPSHRVLNIGSPELEA